MTAILYFIAVDVDAEDLTGFSRIQSNREDMIRVLNRMEEQQSLVIEMEKNTDGGFSRRVGDA